MKGARVAREAGATKGTGEARAIEMKNNLDSSNGKNNNITSHA